MKILSLILIIFTFIGCKGGMVAVSSSDSSDKKLPFPRPFFKAISINPSSQKVNLIFSDDVYTDSTALFTVEMFIRLNDLPGTYYNIFEEGNGVQIYVDSTGQLKTFVPNSTCLGNYNGPNSGGVTLSPNTNYHIAMTYNGASGNVALFLNGAEVGSTSITVPSSGCKIIFPGVGEGGIWVYNGIIDDFRISNFIRYTGSYAVPNFALMADPGTFILFHFDNPNNSDVADFVSSGTASYTFVNSPVLVDSPF